MIFFHLLLNKYTIHWQLMAIHWLWISITFLNFKTSLVITPLPHNVIITHCIQNRYVIHLLPIFNSNLFNGIKIVPTYDHESSKPISLIKRRIDFLTKAFLARFSKIIMFFTFLSERVSRSFENDFIHEIEFSWSVNIGKTEPILAVYCV